MSALLLGERISEAYCAGVSIALAGVLAVSLAKHLTREASQHALRMALVALLLATPLVARRGGGGGGLVLVEEVTRPAMPARAQQGTAQPLPKEEARRPPATALHETSPPRKPPRPARAKNATTAMHARAPAKNATATSTSGSHEALSHGVKKAQRLAVAIGIRRS